jgi:60 kDa SS-A/Ro ribonucleoprotein
LDDVVKYLGSLKFGGTDCALPMVYATEQELDVDGFVIYTDSETWAGNIQPVQALAKYRKAAGKADASCTIVGMTASGFSIADPKDPRMLDVVGFDTATPQVISEFVKGA